MPGDAETNLVIGIKGTDAIADLASKSQAATTAARGLESSASAMAAAVTQAAEVATQASTATESLSQQMRQAEQFYQMSRTAVQKYTEQLRELQSVKGILDAKDPEAYAAAFKKVSGNLEEAIKQAKNPAFHELGDAFEYLSARAERIFAYLAVGFGVREMVEAFKDADEIAGKLAITLDNTANGITETREQLEELAEAEERRTNISHLQIESADVVLGRYRNTGQELQRLTRDSEALSKMMGTDMSNAARIFGMTMENPAQTMMLLRRQGVLLSDQQKEAIKIWEDSGNSIAGADIVLKKFESTMGDAAGKLSTTFGGEMDKVKNSITDLLEAFGAGVGGAGVGQGLKDLMDGFANLVTAAEPVAELFGTVLYPPLELIATVMKALSENVWLAQGAWTALGIYLIPLVVSNLKSLITGMLGTITGLTSLITSTLAKADADIVGTAAAEANTAAMAAEGTAAAATAVEVDTVAAASVTGATAIAGVGVAAETAATGVGAFLVVAAPWAALIGGVAVAAYELYKHLTATNDAIKDNTAAAKENTLPWEKQAQQLKEQEKFRAAIPGAENDANTKYLASLKEANALMAERASAGVVSGQGQVDLTTIKGIEDAHNRLQTGDEKGRAVLDELLTSMQKVNEEQATRKDLLLETAQAGHDATAADKLVLAQQKLVEAQQNFPAGPGGAASKQVLEAQKAVAEAQKGVTDESNKDFQRSQELQVQAAGAGAEEKLRADQQYLARLAAEHQQGTEAYKEAESKVSTDLIKVRDERVQDDKKAFEQEAKASGDSAQAKLIAAQKYLAEVAKVYKEDSKIYGDALDAEKTAQIAFDEWKVQQEKSISQSKAGVQEAFVRAQEEITGKELTLQGASSAQKIAAQEQFETQLHALKMEQFDRLYQDQLAHNASDLAALQAIDADKEKEQIAFGQKMVDLSTQQAQAVQNAWNSALQPMEDKFASTFADIIDRTQKAHQKISLMIREMFAEFAKTQLTDTIKTGLGALFGTTGGASGGGGLASAIMGKLGIGGAAATYGGTGAVTTNLSDIIGSTDASNALPVFVTNSAAPGGTPGSALGAAGSVAEAAFASGDYSFLGGSATASGAAAAGSATGSAGGGIAGNHGLIGALATWAKPYLDSAKTALTSYLQTHNPFSSDNTFQGTPQPLSGPAVAPGDANAFDSSFNGGFPTTDSSAFSSGAGTGYFDPGGFGGDFNSGDTAGGGFDAGGMVTAWRSAWANAPHYDRGGAIPIWAHAGERVLTPAQNREYESGGKRMGKGPEVHFHYHDDGSSQGRMTPSRRQAYADMQDTIERGQR